MNRSNNSDIFVLLNELTHTLKSHQLWQNKLPKPEKLASTLPFCYDTLAFEQWLQFIFIPKISYMITEQLPLPTAISLSPMAEEAFKVLGSSANDILGVISAIDLLLSQPTQEPNKQG